MNLTVSSSVFAWKSSMEQIESAPPAQNQNSNSASNNTNSDNFNNSGTSNINFINSPFGGKLGEENKNFGGLLYLDNGGLAAIDNKQQQQRICDCDQQIGITDRDQDCHSGTSSGPTYKDMATWTVEDDMPSPTDAFTPADSPVLGRIGGSGGRQHECYQFDERDEYPEFRPDDLPLPLPQNSGGTSCFTVSSQLQSREARLYENVPTTQGDLTTLGMLLFQGHSSTGSFLDDCSGGANLPGQHRYLSRQNTPGSSGGGGLHHNSGGSISGEVGNFLNVNDYLAVGGGSGGGPPSRSSWVDSGRESLSFDGESGNTANNSNSNGSSKNLMILPPPISISGSGSSGNINMVQHHHSGCSGRQTNGNGNGRHGHSQGHGSNTNGNPGDPTTTYSPSNSFRSSNKPQRNGSKSGKNQMSRKERLVRQKHAIDENFSPYSLASGISSAAGYLAVPSPRRTITLDNQQQNHQHHHLMSPGAVGISSPINLQRHPNSQQMILQENKKSRGLISGCESPYGTGGMSYMNNDYTRGSSGLRMQSGRSPSRGLAGIGGGGGRRNNGGQSFDYGELPSHQMFPNLKRHLLSGRQFSHPYGDVCNNGNSVNNNPNPFIPSHLQAQHRSFPAGLLSSVAPRSCSMGDLTSGVSPGSLKGKHPNEHQVPISSATNPPGGLSSNVPIVTSLPLPPATSVTYEFSLAPVSGTLAPGWHLTAVQRGLATAVPLAAVVAARRRLPRPRSSRPRFGFTDKSEARRAKWTIAVTALALLAMSMLLVGVTLRLAPLIDDLVRKENEDLLRGVIQQTPSTFTNVSLSSSSSSTPIPSDIYQQQPENVLSRTAMVTGESVIHIPPPSVSLTISKNSSRTAGAFSSPLSQHLLGSRKRK